MELRNMNLVDRIGTLGRMAKIFTRHDKVIKGKIEAYDPENEIIGLSNAIIEEKGLGSKFQQKEVALIVFEKDIKRINFTDKSLHGKTANKENIDQQKTKGKNNQQNEKMQCKANSAEFRIDRDYRSAGNSTSPHRDLEVWQHDEDDKEHAYDPKDPKYNLTDGEKQWPPEEMFKKNEGLGVKSSFNGIESYSTAKPEGNDEDRKRADEIASQIEKCQQSAFHSRLENDDEERDLDKKVVFSENKYRERGGKFNKTQTSSDQKSWRVNKERVIEQETTEVNVQHKDQEQITDAKKSSFNPMAKAFVPKSATQVPAPPPVGYATPPVYGMPYGFVPQAQPFPFVSQAPMMPQTPMMSQAPMMYGQPVPNANGQPVIFYPVYMPPQMQQMQMPPQGAQPPPVFFNPFQGPPTYQ